MKQLLIASTFYQCLSLAAAVDAGVLPSAEKRILLLADSSQVPELTQPLQAHQGFSRVAERFDRVADFAPLVYPRRPVEFAPRNVELNTWQQLLRSHWDLGDAPVQIVMDSVQVNPALALAAVFDEAELYAHSDGLMAYGPTRKPLPQHLAQRMTGLIHLDLVPGLLPRLLAELEIRSRSIPRTALRALIGEIGSGAETSAEQLPIAGRATALILGQYLSSLQLIDGAQESALHQQLIREAAARGAEVCVFKPHPSAPPVSPVDLARQAERTGVELVIDTSPEIAELSMQRWRPQWVFSSFSTGLATARYVHGVEAVAVGSQALLDGLTPYQNSNRIPLVLAEALFTSRAFAAPADTAGTDPRRDLQALVDAVAYCMQPELCHRSAEATRQYLRLVANDPDILATFFRRRRLQALGLPGGLSSSPRSAGNLLRAVRRRASRISGPGVVARSGRSASPG